ncbi:hypothetical protein [Vibrio fluminensis]|uniref:hypothetical protein n=1 Tax=Vibrio fluminensis TaxID=2783614 RepID=UPI00188848B9|nr:hypothetical protein [Vibrio fluminensis]
MSTDNLDLTNTGKVECKKIETDGVIEAECAPKEFADVLYIPQKAEWYLIDGEFAMELKEHAQELDDKIKPLVNKLTKEDASSEEIASTKQEVLQGLNEKGLLESYKTRSHLSFLKEDKDKKEYVQALYTVLLLKTYVRKLESSGKIPRFEKVKDNFNENAEHYAASMGLTESDLVENQLTVQAIKEVERYVTASGGSRYGKADARNIKWLVEKKVIPIVEKSIKELEKQAKDKAEDEGYSWYKSNQSQNFKFVKSEQKRMDKNYRAYQNIIPHFRKRYQKSDYDVLLNEFDKYSSEGRKQPIELVTANTFSVFRSLNRKGVALPEQLLDKHELFAKDDETQEKLDGLLEGSATDRLRYFIGECGVELKAASNDQNGFSRFHYEESTQELKPLSALCQGESVKFIEGLGYLNLLGLSKLWDQELTEYLKFFIDNIIDGEVEATGYAEEGLYFLVALRYQIDYLKHKAKIALEEGKLKFFNLNVPPHVMTRLMPIDDVAWSPDDIEFDEYRFAWKDSNSHIVEFFIMSESNKPRYMHSIHLDKVKELGDLGKLTRLNVLNRTDVKASDSSAELKRTNDIKNSLKKALGDARAAAKANTNKGVNLNAEEDESFTNHTSIIQTSTGFSGGDDVSYTVSAQAEFLRFCADSIRVNGSYPKKYDDFNTLLSERKGSIASLNAAAHIDLAAGGITVKKMLPSLKGFPMLVPAIVGEEGEEQSKYFHLGQLRFDLKTTFYGSVGIGFALATHVRVRSVDSGISLAPIIPTESSIHIPTGGMINAQADLFAGARVGETVSSTVRWCPPGKQATATNFVQLLDDTQRKKLQSSKGVTVDDNNNWLPLGRFVKSYDLRFGIGVRGVLQFGYIKRKFVMRMAGGGTFGVGGSLDLLVEIFPENLMDIVNVLTEILANEEFRRIDLFTEEDESGMMNGYKVLNTIVTMHIVTGVAMSQLALLDINEAFEQEDRLLMHNHSDTVATNVLRYFNVGNSNGQTSLEMQPWFKNLLPESRARLLFTLTKESEALSPELLKRIKSINDNMEKAFPSKKIKPLTEKEKKQLHQGLEEESPRWLAITRLLQTWSKTENEMLTSSLLDRQLEETFSRFNFKGTTMLPSDYGNKIMPIVVWEKLNGFVSRLDRCKINNKFPIDVSLIDALNETNLSVKERVFARFVEYFTVLPKKRFEVQEIAIGSKMFKYYVYNGKYKGNRSLTEIEKFTCYHLARKEIFPDDYEKESTALKQLFTEPTKVFSTLFSDIKDEYIDEAKKDINDLVKEYTGVDNVFDKANTLNEIKQEATKGDYQALLERLGEL